MNIINPVLLIQPHYPLKFFFFFFSFAPVLSPFLVPLFVAYLAAFSKHEPLQAGLFAGLFRAMAHEMGHRCCCECARWRNDKCVVFQSKHRKECLLMNLPAQSATTILSSMEQRVQLHFAVPQLWYRFALLYSIAGTTWWLNAIVYSHDCPCLNLLWKLKLGWCLCKHDVNTGSPKKQRICFNRTKAILNHIGYWLVIYQFISISSW